MINDVVIQSRFLTVSLWLSLAALVVFSGVFNQSSINHWSVSYLENRISTNPTKIFRNKPPESHPNAEIWLAEDAFRRGEKAEAIELIQKLAESGNTFALRLRGVLSAAQGDYVKALQTWMQIGDFQSLYRLARKAESDGDMQIASYAYQIAVEVNLKQGALPYANFLMNKLNDQRTAINVLQLAIQTYNNSPQRNTWLRKLGDIFQHEERWQEAIACYQDILETNSKDFWAHIGLGRVYYKRGDGLQPASQEVMKAIELAPQLGLGYFAMGDILAKDGKYSDADFWFIEAIQREPENKIWQLVRANTIRTAGNLEQALKLYQEIAVNFPDWAPVYYEMAITFKQLKNPEKAMEYIERALTLIQPPNIGYYWRAGQIYEWTGDDERALDAYQSILIIDPSYLKALNAIQRLESNIESKERE